MSNVYKEALKTILADKSAPEMSIHDTQRKRYSEWAYKVARDALMQAELDEKPIPESMRELVREKVKGLKDSLKTAEDTVLNLTIENRVLREMLTAFRNNEKL